MSDAFHDADPIFKRTLRTDQVNWVVHKVAELPNRTSPEVQPKMMLVSADELTVILKNIYGPVMGEALKVT